MKLPGSLVNEFAKILKADTKKPKETTYYATVVSADNDAKTAMVRLDGSELETPAEMAMNVRTGDRVLISIKNHKAVITGNKTAPATANDYFTFEGERNGVQLSAGVRTEVTFSITEYPIEFVCGIHKIDVDISSGTGIPIVCGYDYNANGPSVSVFLSATGTCTASVTVGVSGFKYNG